MAERPCGKKVWLRRGPLSVVGEGDTSQQALDDAFKKVGLVGGGLAAEFIGAPCPRDCDIKISWSRLPTTIGAAETVTDALGQTRHRQAMTYTVEAWVVCLKSRLWIPIYGHLPPTPARTDGSRDCVCGLNEWAHEFQDLGPWKSDKEAARQAMVRGIKRRAKELMNDWLTFSQCDPNCPLKLTIPGPVVVRTIVETHDPARNEYCMIGLAKFTARIYCLRDRELNALLEYMRGLGFITPEEIGEILGTG